ncbi:MAG: TetR/AcrR family transcriptional regulator [Deltaproteobacteria bacterium]|nr:TetR/AcrR family transcriptional regulator [Deltaproteobacteria bacterium]
MKKGDQTRARIVEAARQLFERQGYAATGLQEILKESQAPRGSFYFHFPGGKEALAVAVIEAHAEAFGAGLQAALANAPDVVTAGRLAVELLAGQMEATACQAGCPVSAVTLEMASTAPALRDAAREAFEAWLGPVAARLEAEGLDPELARSRARAVVSALEGALILCRAYGHAGPLRDLSPLMPRLLGA